MKAALKFCVHALVGKYEYWKLFTVSTPKQGIPLPPGSNVVPLDVALLAGSTDPGLRARAWYEGPETQGFALLVDGQPAAIQWYWWGRRYSESGRLPGWTLPANAAKSVDLYTVPSFRGRGYAGMLKCQSAYLMGCHGFDILYSRIWHNHEASISVSTKAGWTHAGSVIKLYPLGKQVVLRRLKQ